jgi:hypothetical protein
VLKVLGKVAYYSCGLGMDVAFTEVTPKQQAKLDHWLNNPEEEF